MFDFFYFISFLGGMKFQTILFASLIIYLYYKNYKKDAIYIFHVSVISAFFCFYLKYFFDITRPENMLILETSPSFPSAHSTMGAVVFSLVTFYCVKYLGAKKNFYKKYFLIVLSFIWMLLVGYSRLYLQAHYPIDILVGYIIGGSVTIFVTILFTHLRYFKNA